MESYNGRPAHALTRRAPGTRIDLTGSTFDRLVVVEAGPVERTRSGRAMTTWICECACGKRLTVRTQALQSGNTSSCGCSRWIGDAPTYKSVHSRITRQRGRAKDETCACGAAAYDWSYNHDDPSELTEMKVYASGVIGTIAYSNDPSHYTARCRCCHMTMDKRMAMRRKSNA